MTKTKTDLRERRKVKNTKNFLAQIHKQNFRNRLMVGESKQHQTCKPMYWVYVRVSQRH